MPDQPLKDAYHLPVSQIIRLAELNARRAQPLRLAPDADARRAVADSLGITGVKKLRLDGTLTPEGKTDWRLEATLGATVVQPCVVTLEPVTTRIDAPVLRRYLADMDQLDGTGSDDLLDTLDAEFEIPEDDSVEPLPATLDIGAVMLEALALALPEWPRAAGAETGEVVLTEPGKVAMRDEDARPFANLRDQLAAKGKGSGADD